MQRVTASVVAVHGTEPNSVKSGGATCPKQITRPHYRTNVGTIDGQSQSSKRNPLHGHTVWQRHQHAILRLKTESAECRKLLEEMQAGCEVFEQFASWTEVATHMENGNIRRLETDAILSPIFARIERNPDQEWQTILQLLFWAFLTKEYRYKQTSDRNNDDRWQNLVLAFFVSVRNLDLNHRQVGLAQKLANDTVHHFYGFCRQFFMGIQHQNVVRSYNPGNLEETVAIHDVDLVEARDYRDMLVRRVLKHAETAVISGWAADVLIATRIYGRRLKDVRGKGCNYETAKKRRQREEARLARVLPIWRKLMPGTRHLGV